MAFTTVLLFAASDLPYRGDPDNQMNQEVSMTGTKVPGNYYIQEAYNDAHTPNIVTVILGDYRSIDTLGEQIVIFTAGLITFLLLRNRKEEAEGGSDDE
ncbi:hydrogen gas-evolving membrane-bound hydrogenase subunit E [Gracilimonas sp.]|uniref:hydrogen gas-evolving membrane-bound hydrogenase subunit E n=1 Tax=Gracilimonas sp. TaxID=1974203 RepID=UPI003BAC309B